MANYKLHIYSALYTGTHIYLRGRMLKDRNTKNTPQDGYFSSLFKSLLRSLTKEVKYQPITVDYLNKSMLITTCDEGYFELMNNVEPYGEVKTVKLSSTYKEKLIQQEVILRTYNLDSKYGIISDLDDTILLTKVKSFMKIQMIFNTLFISPFKRKSIDQAAQFYEKLMKQSGHNSPIFYISNSPWNMYDYLSTFLEHNNFPKGELKLRDFGLQMLKPKKKKLLERNKFKEIENVMRLFPNHQFWLIGDSAELDYKIYRLIQELYPEQVKKIIIRKTKNGRRERRIQRDIDINKNKAVLVDKFSSLRKTDIV